MIANTPCGICETDKSIEFFKTEFNKFNYQGTFHMRRCEGCGLYFCSPRLTEQGIAALYDGNYYVFKKKDDDNFARTAAVYGRTIGMLDGPARGRGRILEVGSGKGYLLAVLKALGRDVLGIEISADAAAYARRVYDVPSFSGTLDAYLHRHSDETPFPLVLCIDIIEHVIDPAAFLQDLARVTAPGGYVIIDTPNGDAAHIGIEGARWRGFNPFHIFFFNRSNLTDLLGRYGFAVERAFTYNNVLDRETPAPPREPAPHRRLIDRIMGRRNTVEPVPTATLEACVEECRSSPGYAATPDASAELAEGLRGENLLVIARMR